MINILNKKKSINRLDSLKYLNHKYFEINFVDGKNLNSKDTTTSPYKDGSILVSMIKKI